MRVRAVICACLFSGLLVAAAPSSASARDLDCADFSSQAEAQENLLPGDPYGLDADNDGIACESNPCPCASGSPSEPESAPSEPTRPPKPPPYRLDKAVAREIAKHLVNQIVNRDPRLEMATFGGCRRQGERLIQCRLGAQGRTATEKVACRYRIVVRAPDRHPVGRIVKHRCQATQVLYLDHARAKQAMQAASRTLAGGPTVVEAFRLSRIEFEGWAEWRRAAGAGGRERCEVEMHARLLPGERVDVEVGKPSCEPL